MHDRLFAQQHAFDDASLVKYAAEREAKSSRRFLARSGQRGLGPGPLRPQGVVGSSKPLQVSVVVLASQSCALGGLWSLSWNLASSFVDADQPHPGLPHSVEPVPSATPCAGSGVSHRAAETRTRQYFVLEPRALACRDQAGDGLCGGHDARHKSCSHSPMRIVGKVAIVEVDCGG